MLGYETVKACWDDIRIDKLGALVKVSGAAWGVMIVVSIFSVGSGLAKLNYEAVEKTGGLSAISVTGGLTEDKMAKVLSYASRDFSVCANVQVQGTFLEEAEVIGTSPSYLDVMQCRIGSGRFISDYDVSSGNLVCCLGSGIALSFFGDANPIGKEIWLEGGRYQVVGVMDRDTGMEGRKESHGLWFVRHVAEMRNRSIHIPYTTAMRMHSGSLKTVDLTFRPASLSELPESLRRIEAVMDHIDPSATATDVRWRFEHELQEAKRFIARGVVALGAIVGVCLFMSGIGVANLMYSQVSKQIKEIGVKKALGATNRSILNFYLAQSVFLSLLGGGLGILLGAAVAWVGNTIVGLPFSISWIVVLAGVVVSVVTGTLAGLAPSLKACHLQPVESLRVD